MIIQRNIRSGSHCCWNHTSMLTHNEQIIRIMLNYRQKISNESAQYLHRCIVSTIWVIVVIYYAGLGSTNIWPTMFGTCM
jgi:hypothetical protein